MPRIHRLMLVLALTLAGGSSPGVAEAQGDDDRFALAGGCYGLKSVAAGRFVSKAADGSYTATGGGESFRMQATALGRFLFYGRKGDFMAAGKRQTVPVPGSPVPPAPTPQLPVPVPNLPVATAAADDPVQSAATPSPAADWRVDGRSGAFAISLPTAGASSPSTAPATWSPPRAAPSAHASPSRRAATARPIPTSSST